MKNYKITERAFNEDVSSTSANKSDSAVFSNQFVIISELKTEVIKARSSLYDEKLYHSIPKSDSLIFKLND